MSLTYDESNFFQLPIKPLRDQQKRKMILLNVPKFAKRLSTKLIGWTGSGCPSSWIKLQYSDYSNQGRNANRLNHTKKNELFGGDGRPYRPPRIASKPKANLV